MTNVISAVKLVQNFYLVIILKNIIHLDLT